MASSVIVFSLFFTGLVANGYSRPEEKKDDLFVLAAKQCNKEINAPERVIENLRRKEPLEDSKEGRCLIQCTLMTLGLIYKNGKINEEMRSQFVNTVLEKPEDQEKLQKVIDQCNAKNEKIEDLCERSFNFLQCYYRESRKENIPLL